MRLCKQELLPLAPIAAAMAAFDRQSKQRRWALRSGAKAMGVPCDEHVSSSGAPPEPSGPAVVPCTLDSTALGAACDRESRLLPHTVAKPHSPSNESDAGPDPTLGSSLMHTSGAAVTVLQEDMAGIARRMDISSGRPLCSGASLMADC